MKILLADDHALFREGLRYVLQQLPEVCEILEAGNFPEALRLAELHPELDLALLDLNMPGSDGPVSVKFFHQRYPHIPVVVVSGEDGRGNMEKVMNSGAMGFVCKSSTAPVMLSALSLVLSGGVYVPPQILQYRSVGGEDDGEQKDGRSPNTNEFGLTPRQMQVLRHLAAGLTNKEIAETIHLAEGTVKIHVAAVYQTLRVSSRMEAVRVAEQLGLVGVDG
ncbi:MAG: response regulator transcription factor [Nitrosomonadales bacterium]|nr:response regulator transcription factor [Nitrosomonadales bacterium]